MPPFKENPKHSCVECGGSGLVVTEYESAEDLVNDLRNQFGPGEDVHWEAVSMPMANPKAPKKEEKTPDSEPGSEGAKMKKEDQDAEDYDYVSEDFKKISELLGQMKAINKAKDALKNLEPNDPKSIDNIAEALLKLNVTTQSENEFLEILTESIKKQQPDNPADEA